MKADYKKLQAVLNQLNQTKETETHRQAKHIAYVHSLSCLGLIPQNLILLPSIYPRKASSHRISPLLSLQVSERDIQVDNLILTPFI